VHQVEGARLQAGREQIVVLEHHVAEVLVGGQPLRLGEHGIVDVGSHHLTVRSGPLAEQAQPPHHAAPDVDRPGAGTLADLLQKPPAAGFPHSRLELEPLQLGDLTCQQICC
jgi:hypothetical protein